MKNENELTDEQIADLDKYCVGYFANNPTQAYDDFKQLICSLKAERAKPKVWDGVPENITLIKCDYVGMNNYYHKDFTRKLPKTRAREIAEKWASRVPGDGFINACYIEDAIREYAEAIKKET